MARLVRASEPAAGRRRQYFRVALADGITPAAAEAGGQPQLNVNDSGWTNVGIGPLVAINPASRGRYYADVDQATAANAGDRIETRYKSAATAETPGPTIRVTSFDPVLVFGGSSEWLIQAGQTDPARLRVKFFCLAPDGLTPVSGESGQPQISSDGGAWTDTGIGALTSDGDGLHYAALDPAVVATAGTRILTRYKSALTAETPGDDVLVTAFDPDAIYGGAGDAIGQAIESALLSLLQAVGFGGIDPANVGAGKLPKVDEQIDGASPWLRLAAGAQDEEWQPLSTEGVVDYRYFWDVAFIKAGNRDLSADPQVRLWVQQGRIALGGDAGFAAVRAAAPSVWWIEIEPDPIYDRGSLSQSYSYSGFTAVVHSAEAR